MKKILVLTSTLLFMTLSGFSFAKANDESLDQILAVVNDDVVTKSEFDHSLIMAKTQITQAHMNMPSAAVLHKQVLEQLINKKLELQLAKQAGVNVTDADIDHTIAGIASQNNMSSSDLYKRIGQEGMSVADYRHELHEQLTVQKLQQQEVVSHINVTPEEINAFMQSKVWQKNTDKEYHLEDILISLSDTPSSDEIATAKKRAESVMAKLNSGQAFSAIAQQESGAANALKGGDLGWLKLPEVPSAFTEHVAGMKEHEVAGPIQTPNGFHILRLVAQRSIGGKSAAPDRKQIQNLLMQRKFEEQVQNWLSKMRSQAFITLPEKKNA